ncbi:MAG: Mrp/NBP35 family ATP-binding protein [Methylotenera sp.]|nr:Mrp/NBP35 family ATP-binding protein [Oligoflexia bacterium]
MQSRDTQPQARPSPIPGVHHIIAISSGKGGVGKSTVAVNLAAALALEGLQVGLMDTDVYGPNVPTMLGVTEQPTLEKDPVRGELLIPPVSRGVKVMSMGFLVSPDQAMIWRGPQLHSVVNQFCHQVKWGVLDFLIIDMPPGTGDVQLSLAQAVPVRAAILVSTPQEVSTQDVRKAHQMFEKVKIPVMGFVENMSYFKCDQCEKQHFLFGEGGGKLLARKFGKELMLQIPIVQKIREGGDEGRPIVIREPGSESAKLFRELARRVIEQADAFEKEGIDPSSIVQIGRFE